MHDAPLRKEQISDTTLKPIYLAGDMFSIQP